VTITETNTNDSYVASTSFDVTILPVNDPPIVVDLPNQFGLEDTNLLIDLGATDIDGDSEFSFIADINSGNNIIDSYSISGNTLTIIPNNNLTGQVSMGITASDGNDNSQEQELVINFENTIDFPFIENITPDPIPDAVEDQESIIFTVNPVDFDVDDNLTVGYLNSNTTLFESITVDPINGGSQETRTFTLVPKENSVWK